MLPSMLFVDHDSSETAQLAHAARFGTAVILYAVAIDPAEPAGAIALDALITTAVLIPVFFAIDHLFDASLTDLPPLMLDRLKASAQEFWRNLRNDGPRRAARIFWMNFVVTKTHYYDTGVPYGRWSDADYRLRVVMEKALIQFLEGDYLNNATLFRGREDLAEEKKTEAAVLELLAEEKEYDYQGETTDQARCARIARLVYDYLKNVRPEMQRRREKLYDQVQWDVSEQDGVGFASLYADAASKEASDKAGRIDAEIQRRNNLACKAIAEIRPWMWM